MNKFLKAGLLIVTLVIPALIFTFLRYFATNHYEIPFYFPQFNPSGEVMISNGDTVYYQINPKYLKSLKGNALSTDQFRNGLTVVNYAPEICDDSCKIIRDQLARIKTLGDGISGLKVITITEERQVSSGDDETIANREGWSVAMFPKDKQREVLMETFKLGTTIPKFEMALPEQKLMLVDRDGCIRGYYMGADKAEFDRLMAEIKILNYEEENSK